ncbi:MAG: hypothetical protein WDO19_28035 [Bacteroidota bacterium]
MNYTKEVSDQYEAFRTELLQNTSFKDVTRSSRIPTGRLLDNMGASVMNGDSLQPVVSDIKYVNCDLPVSEYVWYPACSRAVFWQGLWNGYNELCY